MKRLASLLLTTLLFVSQGWAQTKPLYTIFAANANGTYYHLGEDIARACPSLGVRVVPTEGSLENINLLISDQSKSSYRVAFVQDDVLSSVLSSKPAIRQLIQPLMQLHREDISILTYRGANIRSIRDLVGKRVAVGTPGSGVWFTANVIRSQLGISWVSIERTPEESILGVLVGEIDAVIMVAGAPNKLLFDMGAYVKDRVTLLSLSDLQLNSLYKSATLPSGTYPWQDAAVELRITRSSLIASSDVPQAAVNDLFTCLSKNLPALRRWGHPKWNDVQPLKRSKL